MKRLQASKTVALNYREQRAGLYCTCHSAMLHFNFNSKVGNQPASRKQVALAVTGGIAAYKSIEILRNLQRAGCDVRVAMTRHACEFIQPLTFRALSGSYVIVDDYSPDNPDPIAHITFSQTVDLFVIAPATANVLAKLANGVADDFVTSTYLACKAPILIAPAMNTTMWQHPATRRNVAKLRDDGVYIIQPDAGEMACGTIGPGRLSEPDRIVSVALEILSGQLRIPSEDPAGKRDLASEQVLITAGATREAIDPVRFISNRSSGRMGFALAKAAHQRGAQVKVIAAATSVTPPLEVELINVTSAEEMRDAVFHEIGTATIFIGAAAVSDYRPKHPADTKIKKSQPELTLELERTPDILNAVAEARREGQLIVGFAAETNDLLSNAKRKMAAKNLDMMVANDVSVEGQGFDAEQNRVIILRVDNPDPTELPLLPKQEVAARILDEIVKLRQTRSARAVSVQNK